MYNAKAHLIPIHLLLYDQSTNEAIYAHIEFYTAKL